MAIRSSGERRPTTSGGPQRGLPRGDGTHAPSSASRWRPWHGRSVCRHRRSDAFRTAPDGAHPTPPHPTRRPGGASEVRSEPDSSNASRTRTESESDDDDRVRFLGIVCPPDSPRASRPVRYIRLPNVIGVALRPQAGVSRVVRKLIERLTNTRRPLRVALQQLARFDPE